MKYVIIEHIVDLFLMALPFLVYKMWTRKGWEFLPDPAYFKTPDSPYVSLKMYLHCCVLTVAVSYPLIWFAAFANLLLPVEWAFYSPDTLRTYAEVFFTFILPFGAFVLCKGSWEDNPSSNKRIYAENRKRLTRFLWIFLYSYLLLFIYHIVWGIEHVKGLEALFDVGWDDNSA